MMNLWGLPKGFYGSATGLVLGHAHKTKRGFARGAHLPASTLSCYSSTFELKPGIFNKRMAELVPTKPSFPL
jgi:hypothetical protein